MRMYNVMLSSAPGDKRLMQRVEELRSLLKMLGRDKDALIEGLTNFRDGVMKRRDEFYRNA